MQGDSGGPLTVKQARQHVLIGAVSRGSGCAEDLGPENDGRYARISFARQWIVGEMSNPTFCGGTADASGRRKFRKRKKKIKRKKKNQRQRSKHGL